MRRNNIFWSSEEEKKEEPQQIEIYQAGPVTDDSNVMCEQNRIYFYSEVERTKNLKLNKYIRNLDLDLANRNNILGGKESPPIFLHIQSYGGCVFSGFSSTLIIFVPSNSTIPNGILKFSSFTATVIIFCWPM